MVKAHDIFTEAWAKEHFPQQRTEDFFEALFGEAEEGAYDICLSFQEQLGDAYEFAFELHQRPGKCLVCNLTYGLPQVFSRHPILNVKGVVAAIAQALGQDPCVASWELKPTREISNKQHNVPLLVSFGKTAS